METTGVILFYEKCRLCLNNPGEKNIFDTPDLQNDIIACTGVKILPSDNLPEKICSKCLEIVLNAKELRELVVKNDQHLKTLFLFENDDDSRETVCLENYVNDEADKPTQSKKRKCDSAGEHSNSQKDACPVVKVRKDLFETATTTTGTVKVKSKEDYKQYKERIKMDPDFVVEYECETCDRKYDSWKKLYLHTRQHNKKHVCPLDGCGKSFSTKGDLEKHLRTHTGVRPYTCEICDKTFTQQGTLKHHKEHVHYCFTITGP